jgi:hypothetical protein
MALNSYARGVGGRLFAVALAVAVSAGLIVALGRGEAFYEFFFGYQKYYRFFLNDFHLGNWHLAQESARAAATTLWALYVVLGLCFPIGAVVWVLFGRITFRSALSAFCALALYAPWYAFQGLYRDYPTPITDLAELQNLQCIDQRTGVRTVWYYQTSEGAIIPFHEDGYFNEAKLKPSTPQICAQIRARAAASTEENQRVIKAAAARDRAEAAADAAYKATLAITYAGEISGRRLQSGTAKEQRTFEIEMNPNLEGGKIWIYSHGNLIWDLGLEGKMTAKNKFVGRTNPLTHKDYYPDDVTIIFYPDSHKLDWFSRDEHLKIELYGTLFATDPKGFSRRMLAIAAKHRAELEAQQRAAEEAERRRRIEEERQSAPQIAIRQYYCEADGLGGNGAGQSDDYSIAKALALGTCNQRALFCSIAFCR